MTIDQFVNLTSGEYLACLEFVYERLIKYEPRLYKYSWWIIHRELAKVWWNWNSWVLYQAWLKDASWLSERCYEWNFWLYSPNQC